MLVVVSMVGAEKQLLGWHSAGLRNPSQRKRKCSKFRWLARRASCASAHDSLTMHVSSSAVRGVLCVDSRLVGIFHLAD